MLVEIVSVLGELPLLTGLSKRDVTVFESGVVFGSDDYCASVGATRTTDAKELLYPRQKIVLIAKALQLQAIDLVHIDYKDIEGIRSPDDIEISDELTIGSRCHS